MDRTIIHAVFNDTTAAVTDIEHNTSDKWATDLPIVRTAVNGKIRPLGIYHNTGSPVYCIAFNLAIVRTAINDHIGAINFNGNTRCLAGTCYIRFIDAVDNFACTVQSCDHTRNIRPVDSAGHRQVLDSRVLNRAEETGVAAEIGIEITFDAIDSHRLAVAVKGTGKLINFAALLSDGRPVRHSDARAQFEILAAVHCTAVHVRGQLIQLRLGRDHVRVSLRTGACPDSLRRPCACAQAQRHDQRQNGCQQFLHVSNPICFRFPQDASF